MEPSGYQALRDFPLGVDHGLVDVEQGEVIAVPLLERAGGLDQLEQLGCIAPLFFPVDELLDDDAAAKRLRRRGDRRDQPAAEAAQAQLQEATEPQETDADAEPSTESPKHLGGGVYELSDGSKVRGKAKAAAAQAQLQEA